MAQLIPQFQPPVNTPPELAEWLKRLVIELNSALILTGDYTPLYQMPNKVAPGMVRFFGQAIAPDITAEGLWQYTSGGWVQL